MSIAIDTRPRWGERNKLLTFCKGLSNRIRIDIAYLLAEEGPMRPTDIAIALGEPQANISYHLGCMRKDGVLISEESGREVFYQVSPKTADVLATMAF